MIKKELANVLIDEVGFSKSEALAFLDTTVGVIKKTVSKGENVTLVGFGTFSMNTRLGRVVKIPTTGKEIKIKNKNVVKFEPGKKFKEQLNKKTRR